MGIFENVLVIDCEKRIELNGYNYLNNIDVNINNYEQNNQLITGDIKIVVDYNQENELNVLEEIVPFEVNLYNENYNNVLIDEISIINFRYYEIVNQGLQCSFQIKITLKEKECLEEKEELKEGIEVFNDFVNIVDPLEEEIKEKYDDLLDEIFNEEQSLEVIENEQEIVEQQEDREISLVTSVCERIDDNKLSFRNISETSGTYRIYYPRSENEIDKVCVSENVSLTNIYNNSLNKEFSKKKRIIIEK